MKVEIFWKFFIKFFSTKFYQNSINWFRVVICRQTSRQITRQSNINGWSTGTQMRCKSFDFQFIVLYVTNTAYIWLSWLLKQSRNIWNTLWSEETETIQSYINNIAWQSLQKCTINPHCASFWVHFDKIGQLRKHKRWNMRFAIFTESVHAKQYWVIQSA